MTSSLLTLANVASRYRQFVLRPHSPQPGPAVGTRRRCEENAKDARHGCRSCGWRTWASAPLVAKPITDIRGIVGVDVTGANDGGRPVHYGGRTFAKCVEESVGDLERLRSTGEPEWRAFMGEGPEGKPRRERAEAQSQSRECDPPGGARAQNRGEDQAQADGGHGKQHIAEPSRPAVEPDESRDREEHGSGEHERKEGHGEKDHRCLPVET